MAGKSLEERQAEMRKRVAQQKRTPNVPAITIEERPTGLGPQHSERSNLRTKQIDVEGQPPSSDRGLADSLNIKKIDGSPIVSREDLYKIVWSEPMIKLASRFGVSDVAVAKACRKHKIPLPGRGYWARIAVGQNVSRGFALAI